MEDKLFYYSERKLDSSKIWILFLFLGWSYGSMGSMGKQILYYLTLGGFGFWALIRLFTLNSAIKKYNKNIANQLGFSAEDLLKMGLI